MWTWLKQLDQILRGGATRPEDLREGMIRVPARGLSVVIVALGMIYGMCMGSFALFREGGPSVMQFVASTLKVPLLFLLTLVVTFPSLYVFNALVGSRLNLLAVLRLLIAALGVNLAVLASVGPIVAFFSLCTTSYSFMVLFNVFWFTVAGTLGLEFLLQTLHRLSIAWRQRPPPALPATPAAPDASQAQAPHVADLAEGPGPLDRLEGHVLGKHVKTVFGCWVVIFGLVGAQMGWVLRPFIGDPNRPFEWFRERESNFFEAVWHTLRHLLS